MSRAKTSPKQDQERDWLENVPVFGSQWLIPFAHFVLHTSSSKTSQDLPPRWVPVQENLLSEPSSPTWPKQGMKASGSVSERVT